MRRRDVVVRKWSRHVMMNRSILVRKGRVVCGQQECREAFKGECRSSEAFGACTVRHGGCFIRLVVKKHIGRELDGLRRFIAR